MKKKTEKKTPVGSFDEDHARVAVHNAIMSGLDAAGIPYDSDGESYWIDYRGGTLWIGVENGDS